MRNNPINRTSDDGRFRSLDQPAEQRVPPPAAGKLNLGAQAVSRQLARMLADDLFVRSARLSRFLRYIVEQGLQGKGEQLNQYAIALAAFDKPADFDPNTDPIVRVEAGRLRAKLREYYATTGSADTVYIGIPKAGYCPFFTRRSPLQPPDSTWSAPVAHARTDSLKNTAAAGQASTRFDRGTAAISLAVLPFASLSQDVGVALLATELRKQVTRELIQITRTRGVRARIFELDVAVDDIRQIDRDLKATAVLEGSVQEVDGQIRIFSMLARSSDACGIWADSYSDHLPGLSGAMPRAIAQDIAAVLLQGSRASAAAA